MAAEPLRDDNPVEEILLTAFPNPERIGCPTPETIQALGQRRIGKDDPAWDHVWHCSPCFADFKVYRDKRLAGIAFDEQLAKRKRQIRFLLVATLTAACFIAVLVLSTGRIRSLRGTQLVAVDLSNASTFRDLSEDDGKVLARLPTKLDELHITLPRFSPQGSYVLAILRSKSESAAIAMGSAATTGTDVESKVVVTLDLSGAKPGRYFLATRREEQGQDAAAYYFPVLVTEN